MNIILTTLNSKFIHSALSIRYLKSYSNDIAPIELMEFTVNQNIDYIAGEIYKKNPDVLGFSTYIWNREETLKICEILKIINPEIKIILGGPEVSFDGDRILEKHEFIDFIIYGEGEATFKELLKTIIDDKSEYGKINGIIYREDNRIIQNPPRLLIENLDSIPSPYGDMANDFKNKIVYFESSRGCPFNCQFCLSSTIKGVRYFSLDRAKEDLDRLIKSKVKQVKFVDRTFNANKKYAMEIMNFIMEKDPKDINFHFEVTAHLLDREMLDFIKKAKEGLFQFEIGVQSTNPKTIEAVGRTTDFNKLKRVCKEIKRNQNIHQHLDLIAGLPYENYKSFKESFNDVYGIRPEKIQLGFLKLLKGSGLRKNKDKYNFKFLDAPPYEVLETEYISYGEMLKLKGIEDLVEKYYNEGFFQNSLEYLVNNKYKTPFDFFEDFLGYWEEKKYHTISHSRNRLYQILLDFYREKAFDDLIVFKELIKYDYLFNNNNPNIPGFIERDEVNFIQRNKHDILKNQKLLNGYLAQYKDKPTKQIINKIHIEKFKIDIEELIKNDYKLNNEIIKKNYILFEYTDGSIIRCKTYDITEFIPKE
ncbi:B12-binding domain-containing radical SAM protein [Clostridium sp. Cult2]|uniref:B12-binding domain-containing radical SAM protein n=1 Tax=Clostridium sp. Cult2 TaxID=2079003 RepID=UPI001F1BABA8|nr:B12-binding domain-containing radical SAM protein [Clostridium sp. Cult2]MCF6465218.1 B12-binding domain-containing radical SAM protein [Clostridium sp. Cult2]